RALLDSLRSRRFVTIAVLLHIVLDRLFIDVFNLGIKGAAYATVISQGSSFLYGFIYVLVKRLAPFSMPTLPSKSEVSLILYLGIPSGLQMTDISAGSASIMIVVTSFGGDVVGVFGAA